MGGQDEILQQIADANQAQESLDEAASISRQNHQVDRWTTADGLRRGIVSCEAVIARAIEQRQRMVEELAGMNNKSP